MSQNTTRAFIYARKSTDTEDRQVYSIDHQLRELRELACREGFDVVAEFTEHRTAKVPGRRDFNNMLRRMQQGEASLLLAWHPDRLARNGVDGGQLMHLIDTGVIVNLRFAEFWFEPTPQGVLMLSIAFGMSKYYIDALGQGVKRAYRRRIEDGYWPRRPPLGYHFNHDTRTVVLDPVRAPLIRLAFELYASGRHTLADVTQTVNDRGLVGSATKHHKELPLSCSQYHRLLQNPFYAGVLRYKGEPFEGRHPHLVSSRLFDKCQVVRARTGRDWVPSLKPFLYRGMFRCGQCGCTMTNETQKGHNYLRCTKRKGPCSQPYLREEEVSWQISRKLRRAMVPSDAIEWMLTELKTKQRNDAASWSEEVVRAKTALTKHEEKESRLTAVYVDGTMPASEFREAKTKLLADKRSATERLTFLQKNRETRFEPAIRFIRGLTEASIVATSDDTVAKRDFLKKTGSNLRVEQGCLKWEGRGPWNYVMASGFFAKRDRSAPPTGAPSDNAVHVHSTWGTEGGAARMVLEQIDSSFVANPAWE